jgi:hypothetical protein
MFNREKQKKLEFSTARLKGDKTDCNTTANSLNSKYQNCAIAELKASPPN